MARPRRQEFHPLIADFRRANGLTQEEVAEKIGITPEMVRRHERGISMPIALYRRRYCALFGTSETALGLRIGTPTQSILTSQSFPKAVSIGPTGFQVPEFGDSTYLEAVQGYIRHIVALDNRFGGSDLMRLGARLFRTVRNQIGTGAYDPRVERDMQSTAGELAEVVGWLAYDAAEHDLTRRMNQESLYFTRLAGDRTMELLTLQNASMHAGALGRPAEALQIANSVLEHGHTLSPRLRSMFLTRQARALAQAGDAGALKVFDEVRSTYLQGVRDTDPAWAWWIDERELSWQQAMAHQDLGDTGLAIEHFERSIAGIPSREMRSQYVHRAHLLSAQVNARSWRSAEATIREINPLVGEVASTRTVILLRGILAKSRTGAMKIPPAFLDQAEELSDALDTAPA